MKVGDLVTLRWGEHPRKVGTIIKLGPDSFTTGNYPRRRKVLWFGTGITGWISTVDLEKVND
jgi:hypothetical protein